MFNAPSFFGFRSGSYGIPFVGLLDTYGGAAAAYSLRGLSTSYVTGGTPYACQVRNSSNVSADIGFVYNPLTGDYDLDTAALLAHCGGGDGFVDVWYDQSGNGRDAVQSIALNQPQIVSSGSVILDNGKPSLQFDGSNDAFTTSVSFTQPFFVSLVVKNTKASNTYPYYLDSNSTGRFLLYVEDTNGIVASAAYVSGTLLISGINKTVQSLVSVLYNTTSSFIAIDGTIAVSGGIQTNNINSPIYIGSRNTNAQNMQGTYQELIFWDSNQSSNRTGIETNINNFYSIYP